MESRYKKILHIYNRGNRKELICRDIKDYIFLFNLFRYHFHKNKFDLLCFCIMPNHFHVLAIQIGEVHIAKVMQKISSRYTKYINERYRLVGHLFQSNYKTKVIKNKEQLQIVAIYIFNNLAEKGILHKFPKFYYDELLLKHYLLNTFPEEEETL